MIFETHAHYDDEKFDLDRDELLSHILRENNIGKIVNVGASLDGCKESIELAHKYKDVYASVGIHPEYAPSMTEEDLALIEKMAAKEKVVAIGEIGLDYYWCKDPLEREKQKYWFKEQLKLAKKLDLPVIIHSRDACVDTLDILNGYTRYSVPGIVHCFSYTIETARSYVDLGWYIGVGGVITFKNGKKLREVVENIPLERIVLETDAPYMAPEPHRGERNVSIYLKQVAEKIAEIKNISVEEVEEVTFNNALSVYHKVKEEF